MNSTLQRINSRIRELLEAARASLRGERMFGVEDIREIQKPMTEMEPILKKSAALRRADSEVGQQIDEYKSQLRELKTTLEQVEIMLIARRASLEACRSQLAAASLWVATCQRTR